MHGRECAITIAARKYTFNVGTSLFIEGVFISFSGPVHGRHHLRTETVCQVSDLGASWIARLCAVAVSTFLPAWRAPMYFSLKARSIDAPYCTIQLANYATRHASARSTRGLPACGGLSVHRKQRGCTPAHHHRAVRSRPQFEYRYAPKLRNLSKLRTALASN